MKTVGVLGMLLLAACNGDHNAALVKQRKQVETEAAAKREATAVRVKAMSVPELAQTLEQQSVKGTEPFNSPAFKELIARGAGAAVQLAPLITKKTPDSFLGLLALRQLDAARYRALDPTFRIAVLVDTLRGEKYFNSFGLPHTRGEAAARAIVEEGQGAVGPLSALLGDKRPAPVFGSELYVEYKQYHYRVCDYALAYIEEIRGDKFVMPVDPADRDRLIAALLAPPPQ